MHQLLVGLEEVRQKGDRLTGLAKALVLLNFGVRLIFLF